MSVSTEGINLNLTSQVSTTITEKRVIKGDTKYSSTTIFINPCDALFNYSTTKTGSEKVVRSCHNYYIDKHLNQLSNCKRMPDIGDSLDKMATEYNCPGDPTSGLINGQPYAGKCGLSRRQPKTTPRFGLENTDDKWKRHMDSVSKLPKLSRQERFIPGLITLGILGIAAGPAVKTYHLTNANSDNIEKLADITNLHSGILNESTQFLDSFRQSIMEIEEWANEVEERLGDDTQSSRVDHSSLPRGKLANLVKNYIDWFNVQEKLLIDVNQAAAVKRIPAGLKTVLNVSNNFEIESNMSSLIECNYRIEDKNLLLELEFILPTVDENLEVLKVHASDHYSFNNITEDKGEEMCWSSYVGPSYVVLNKTNGCIRQLKRPKYDQAAIRGVTCNDQTNDLNDQSRRGLNWALDCSKESFASTDRIQISEINNQHKIYCYPFDLDIENETVPCPYSPFLLNAHSSYRIAGITHEGHHVNATLSRAIRSAREITANPRTRRSALPAEVTTAVPPTQPTTTSTTKQTIAKSTTTKPKLGDSLRTLGNQMNETLTKIKDSVKQLHGKFNLTKPDAFTFIEKPYELITGGLEKITNYLKSLSSLVGLLTGAIFLVVLMPLLELIILSYRVAKIPARLWLSSARRVKDRLTWTSNNSLPNPFRRRRKCWDDSIKMI